MEMTRKEHLSLQDIINAIEEYIQRVTKRNALQLDSALGSLEALEGDLSSIINDVKECIEGRV